MPEILSYTAYHQLPNKIYTSRTTDHIGQGLNLQVMNGMYQNAEVPWPLVRGQVCLQVFILQTYGLAIKIQEIQAVDLLWILTSLY